MHREGTKPHYTLITGFIDLPAEVTDRLGIPATKRGKKIATEHYDGRTIRRVRGDILAKAVNTFQGWSKYPDRKLGQILGRAEARAGEPYLRPVVHTLIIFRAKPCAECVRSRGSELELLQGYEEGYHETQE